jgi:hypothetical protein
MMNQKSGRLTAGAGDAKVGAPSAEHAGMGVGASGAGTAFSSIAVVAVLLALAIGPGFMLGLGEMDTS